MTGQHVEYVKHRFGAHVYVSKRGDVLVAAETPIVASAREIGMNSNMALLWSARAAYARGKAEDYLRSGDWVSV